MNLKPYDLLFYKGTSFISKFIQKETDSKYSHVAIVIDDKHLAEINRSYNSRIDHIGYNKQHFDVYRLKDSLTDEQKENINQYIYETINSKYDFVEILNMYLLKFFGIIIRDNPNKFICSSWTNKCFIEAGIELSDKKYPTPQDLISDKLILIE